MTGGQSKGSESSGISNGKLKREGAVHARQPQGLQTMFRKLIATASLSLLSVAGAMQPVQAQQWGLLYPDGSIRQRGVLIEGPNPGRIIESRLLLPNQQRTIDLNSGTISRGGIIESGPNPMLRLQICMQTGIC